MARLEQGWDLLVSGGPIMIPLALLCLWMWFLIFRELMSLKRFPATFSLNQVMNDPGRDRGAGPILNADPRRQALAWFMVRRTGDETDRLLWQAVVGDLWSGLGRRADLVMMLAMTAPLLGLLGTVMGMVETFEAIGWYGLGNIQALAAGIEEALITTQTGLLIAIAGLFGSRVLSKRARRIRQDLLAFYRAVDGRLTVGVGHA